MIGEIRDADTAEIAMRASLTGHLVLSTLHTNDATSAFSRLKDSRRRTLLDRGHHQAGDRPAAGPCPVPPNANSRTRWSRNSSLRVTR